jgi:hypothetical protein
MGLLQPCREEAYASVKRRATRQHMAEPANSTTAVLQPARARAPHRRSSWKLARNYSASGASPQLSLSGRTPSCPGGLVGREAAAGPAVTSPAASANPDHQFELSVPGFRYGQQLQRVFNCDGAIFRCDTFFAVGLQVALGRTDWGSGDLFPSRSRSSSRVASWAASSTLKRGKRGPTFCVANRIEGSSFLSADSARSSPQASSNCAHGRTGRRRAVQHGCGSTVACSSMVPDAGRMGRHLYGYADSRAKPFVKVPGWSYVFERMRGASVRALPARLRGRAGRRLPLHCMRSPVIGDGVASRRTSRSDWEFPADELIS